MSVEAITDTISMIDSPYHGRRGVLGTYLIRGEKSAVIDPGPAPLVPGVIEALEETGVTHLDYVLLTHIHLDHAAGSWKMLEAYPDATIHCHPRGAGHVIDPTRLLAAAREIYGDALKEFGEVRGVPAERVAQSTDGETLDLGGILLETIWTPGHSSHSQSYFEPSSGVVFVGDAAGHYPENKGVLVPGSPPPHNPAKAADSLLKLMSYEPKTIAYSHFGFYGDAMALLERFLVQTRLWDRVARDGVEAGLSLKDIFDLLVEEDPEARELAGIDEEGKRAVYFSLKSFVGYAKWLRKSL
ncbi:MBL fold metallo-hydrolase [Candidatus Bathyarchaeota archaeon]|nr:MBL fold metallo-hydrolase [Candidatus Bathyarchaeota archaeon]